MLNTQYSYLLQQGREVIAFLQVNAVSENKTRLKDSKVVYAISLKNTSRYNCKHLYLHTSCCCNRLHQHQSPCGAMRRNRLPRPSITPR